MQDYDQMASGINVPFAMLSGPISYKSKYINTDKNGFRYTKFKDKYIAIEDIDKFEIVNILVGGSSVFGVGASNDETTISSYLSQKTNEVWMNLGVRGGVSFTEYIHLIRFVYKAKKIKNIVFFSGINDIYINQLKDTQNDFDNLFNNVNLNSYSWKKSLLVSFFSKFYNVSSEELFSKSLKQVIFFRKYQEQHIIKKMTDLEKFDKTVTTFDRNFMLYSALKKELDCNILYVLQPFTDWTNKQFTLEENAVFEELEQIQKNSKWASHRSKLTKDLYVALGTKLQEISQSRDVKFIDSHKYFNTDKTFFVDAVHLNDDGNNVVANLIKDAVNEFNQCDY